MVGWHRRARAPLGAIGFLDDGEPDRRGESVSEERRLRPHTVIQTRRSAEAFALQECAEAFALRARVAFCAMRGRLSLLCPIPSVTLNSGSTPSIQNRLWRRPTCVRLASVLVSPSSSCVRQGRSRRL